MIERAISSLPANQRVVIFWPPVFCHCKERILSILHRFLYEYVKVFSLRSLRTKLLGMPVCRMSIYYVLALCIRVFVSSTYVCVCLVFPVYNLCNVRTNHCMNVTSASSLNNVSCSFHLKELGFFKQMRKS